MERLKNNFPICNVFSASIRRRARLTQLGLLERMTARISPCRDADYFPASGCIPAVRWVRAVQIMEVDREEEASLDGA